jgi:DNA-binding response OmpR family regulator
VDDEAAVVSYLEMVLRDEGYDTISASDGESGLQLAAADAPDLLVLDHLIPRASGTRLYQDLKQTPARRHAGHHRDRSDRPGEIPYAYESS